MSKAPVSTLAVGMTAEKEIVVEDAHTAAKYGSGLAPVLSTPHVVAMFECAAKDLIEAHVETPLRSSVGASVSVKHIAPTPVGMKARFKVTVSLVEGRKVRFTGEAYDDVEKFAECEHERFIIDNERFMAKVAEKTAKVHAK
eukprot:m51a1_g6392 hypothetical protein (142) ;mRNA; f:204899-205466